MADPTNKSLQGIINWVKAPSSAPGEDPANDVNANTLDGKHYSDIIADATAASGGGCVALGTASFVGNGGGRAITFSPDLGATPYTVNITPNADGNSRIGEYWYIKNSGNSFTVYNDGSASGVTFDWSVSVKGALPPGTVIEFPGTEGKSVALYSDTAFVVPSGVTEIYISASGGGGGGGAGGGHPSTIQGTDGTATQIKRGATVLYNLPGGIHGISPTTTATPGAGGASGGPGGQAGTAGDKLIVGVSNGNGGIGGGNLIAGPGPAGFGDGGQGTWGAGGGGGSRGGAYGVVGGGGGGSGACIKNNRLLVTPGETLTVIVGKGGNGGAPYESGWGYNGGFGGHGVVIIDW